MTLNILPVSKARSQLLKLVKTTALNQDIILTKDGEPVSVLMNIEDYKSILPLLESQRKRKKIKIGELMKSLRNDVESVEFENENDQMEFVNDLMSKK
jgi:prevent-host-death family protein